MPGLDEELDQLLADDAPSAPAFDLDADIDATLADSAPAPKQSKVIEMPVQRIEGEVPKAEPKPNWWKALGHGLASGATLNWGEELAGPLSAGLSSILPGVNDPEGYTREYAAGSQGADATNVMEGENAALREEQPGAFIGGEVLGSLPGAIATSGGAMGAGRLFGTAAAQGAVSGAGAAPGDRLKGAAIGAAAGAASAGLARGAGEGLANIAKNAPGIADELMTQTFMTPTQRSAYKIAHGKDSLQELGADAREAGLFKAPWYAKLLPTTASRVANNAEQTMLKSGERIGQFEDGLARDGVNPDIDVRPIVSNLRGEAQRLEAMPSRTIQKGARPINEQADDLELPSTATVRGKVERPPAIPEWAREQPSAPKYGAAVEPVQEPLPGTELPPVLANRPVAPKPAEQLEFPTPRAMPARQLELDTTPAPAPRAEPTQLEFPTPREQPSKQLDLGLEPQQAKLPLPPPEARKLNVDAPPANSFRGATGQDAPAPAYGADPQEPLFLGIDPAKPPAEPPSAFVRRGPRVPGQMDLDLPARQIELPLGEPRPNPFVPGNRSGQAQQLPLPVQSELPLPAPAAAPKPAPAWRPEPPKSPLAGQQEALPLENPNRGPQPELSTPLDPAQAQISRESMPLDQASAFRRELGKRINWQKDPNARPTTYEKDWSQKTVWKGLADQIDAALKGDERVDPHAYQQYLKDKRDYHAAATAYNPAIKMTEREGEIGASRGLLAGAALGDPLLGGLSAMASKKMAGAAPSMAAGTLRRAAAVSKPLAPLLKGGANTAGVRAGTIAGHTLTDKQREEQEKQRKEQLDADIKVELNKLLENL